MKLIPRSRLRAILAGCGIALVGWASTQISPRRQGVEQAAASETRFELPSRVGSWELIERLSLPEKELAIFNASDHWRYVYRCRDTKHLLVATLIAAEGGPLLCHLPEVCYERNAFESHATPRLWRVDSASDEFRFQKLTPRDHSQPSVTVAYAWHDGQRWSAPAVPRMQLAGHPTLKRLYITARSPSGHASELERSMQTFLQKAIKRTTPATTTAQRTDPSPSSHPYRWNSL